MRRSHIRISSILFLIVILAWPVLTILTVPSGTIESQLEQIHDNFGLHAVNFAVALLIGPGITWMLVAYKRFIDSKHDVLFHLAIACYSVYLILVTISYGSQVSVLPKLLSKGDTQAAMRWFFYNDHSIPMFINQSGYLFWSVGTLFFFGKHIGNKGFLNRLIMGLLMLSASLQIFASMGMYFQQGAITKLSLPSGLILIPVGFLILTQSFRPSSDTSKSR